MSIAPRRGRATSKDQRRRFSEVLLVVFKAEGKVGHPRAAAAAWNVTVARETPPSADQLANAAPEVIVVTQEALVRAARGKRTTSEEDLDLIARRPRTGDLVSLCR